MTVPSVGYVVGCQNV